MKSIQVTFSLGYRMAEGILINTGAGYGRNWIHDGYSLLPSSKVSDVSFYFDDNVDTWLAGFGLDFKIKNLHLQPSFNWFGLETQYSNKSTAGTSLQFNLTIPLD